jgi:Raf kinase inhibitor-like YbhB/YbcL family protein
MGLVRQIVSLFLAIAVVLIAPFAPAALAIREQGKESAMFQIKSPAFNAEGDIPSRFTCEGDDISPELSWTGAPQATKSFALIAHDPDAPRAGGWTHWVAFNIPANTSRIPENAPKSGSLPGGGVQGRNDGGKQGYMGPCPPSGTHRYYFRLYALNTTLDLSDKAAKSDLEKAMRSHIVGQAELMGRYKKGSSKAA